MTGPAAPASGGPLTGAEFARLMAAVGPFETKPHIAVAVSGGPDSMALALLLSDWSRQRGGAITAITVDHGLRAEAAAEARRVGEWLKPRGIGHRILRWRPLPADLRGGLQAAARAARYRLLSQWCRRHGVLHLALAHQLEDQAETFLLRLGRGSGLDGLAAMAPIAERDGVRLIRPLLPVAGARLRATLTRRRQSWIDDPSNDDAAHARVRMRRIMPALAAEGVDAARLAATAVHLGRARAALDDAVAELLAAAASPDPSGYVLLEPRPLRDATAEVSSRAVARCLVTVGGGAYAPRWERLRHLCDRVRAGDIGGGMTLGGCRIMPRRDRIMVCREPAAAVEATPIGPGEAVWWDQRFQVRWTGRKGSGGRGAVVVRKLGAEGWSALIRQRPDLRQHPMPSAARPSLPALWRGESLLAVPHLDVTFARDHMTVAAVFAPRAPLAQTRFTVA